MVRKHRGIAGPIEAFTIFDHPRDAPSHFVVRRFVGDVATRDVALANSLPEARALIPHGLVKMHRSEDDDPTIVETWL